MLKRRILSVILVLAMLVPAAYAAQPAQDGMRGVWVSSVANIDYPSQQGLSADQLKSEADTILNNIAAMGLNTVFLQVRPSADALYQSALFPWSRYVSGTAGQAPDGDFDVLAYWVEGAHSRSLQLPWGGWEHDLPQPPAPAPPEELLFNSKAAATTVFGAPQTRPE